jgi:hypothetical protein
LARPLDFVVEKKDKIAVISRKSDLISSTHQYDNMNILNSIKKNIDRRKSSMRFFLTKKRDIHFFLRDCFTLLTTSICPSFSFKLNIDFDIKLACIELMQIRKKSETCAHTSLNINVLVNKSSILAFGDTQIAGRCIHAYI